MSMHAEHSRSDNADNLDSLLMSDDFYKLYENNPLLTVVKGLTAQLATAHQEVTEANYNASHDKMTELLNKDAWLESVEAKISVGKPFGIIFADMDNLKQINDSLGHVKADDLIKARATRLSQLFKRHGDQIEHQAGRFGGDEFGVIFDLGNLGGANRSSTPTEEFSRTIEWAKFQLGLPIVLKGTEVSDFGMSVGGALWTPDSKLSSSRLLELADQDMYDNKAARKNR